jgi:hypothetical protein
MGGEGYGMGTALVLPYSPQLPLPWYLASLPWPKNVWRRHWSGSVAIKYQSAIGRRGHWYARVLLCPSRSRTLRLLASDWPKASKTGSYSRRLTIL